MLNTWNSSASWKCREIAKPSDEEELARLVRTSKRIRVVGARHGAGRCAECDDICVSLERLSSLSVLHAATGPLLRVRGSVPVSEAAALLRQHGLAFFVVPPIDCFDVLAMCQTQMCDTACGRSAQFCSYVARLSYVDLSLIHI